jgi:CRISPR-associated protein Cas5d
MPERFCLEVAGDFACFTRPEMKVERVSYDAITPSACRAIFEAILWKPAIRWQPERVEVLAPIRWATLRRNEVASKISQGNVRSAMRQGAGALALYIEDERQQRASLLLRDVRYRLTASFQMTALAGEADNARKFAEMFVRRTTKGQCFHRPYLGCREFACDFRLVEDGEPPAAIPDELRGERDLGWMLYDMDYANAADPKPRFFRARLIDGAMAIPAFDSEEVRG